MLIRHTDFLDALVYSFVPHEKFVSPLNFEPAVKRNVLKTLVHFKNCLDCHRNVDFHQFVLVSTGLHAGAVVFKQIILY